MNGKDVKNVNFENYEIKVNVENSVLHFDFYGILKEDNVGKEQISNILNNIFTTKNFGTNIEQVVYYIRTILNQYDEKKLLVEIKDLGKGVYEKVNIEDKKITDYKKSRTLKLNDEDEVEIEIKFSETDGFSVHIPNQFNSINSLHFIDCQIQDVISSSYRLISNINGMKMLDNMYFDTEEKMLIDIYQMFFDENPDFSKEETAARAQSMMYILRKYVLDPDKFCMNNNQEYPISENTRIIIERLAPFGEISEYRGAQFYFKATDNNNIIRIGKLIREFCDNYNKDKKDELLNNISSILYVMDNLPSGAMISDVVNCPYVKCHREITRNIIGLLAVIEELINKNKTQLEQYENLYNACSKYHDVELPSYENMPRFNVEREYNKIAQGGFIEKYCLSEEEQKKLQLIRSQKNN